MSKQVNKLVDEIIKNLNYKESFYKIIQKYANNSNEFELVNLIVKELSNRGYIIESTDPFIIKEV